MQKELERMKPQLLRMAEENAKMMKFINDETQEMQYTTEIVRSEEVIAKRQAASAQALKDECEAELAEAIPALEMAIAALDTLKVFNAISKDCSNDRDGNSHLQFSFSHQTLQLSSQWSILPLVLSWLWRQFV